MVRSVNTLPCTLPSSPTAFNQEVICDARFSNNKYLAINFASGMSSFSRTSSATIGCPFSVCLSGFHPKSIRRSAICLRDAGLNTVTLSFNFLPVFSEYLCSTIGLNTSCKSFLIFSDSSFNLANNCIAFGSSSVKPLASCLSMIALI